MSHWNIRVVNEAHENGGEPWYIWAEVFYDDNGKPTGYGELCLGDDKKEFLPTILERMKKALELPVINGQSLKEE